MNTHFVDCWIWDMIAFSAQNYEKNPKQWAFYSLYVYVVTSKALWSLQEVIFGKNAWTYPQKNMCKISVFFGIIIKFELGLGKGSCWGPVVFSS